MSIATALGQAAPAKATGPGRLRRTSGPSRFHMPDSADLPVPSTEATAALAPLGLHTLLAMQEADADAVQDRAARRHAGSMLTEMSAMQRALLQGDDAVLSTTLDRLAGLARHAPAALDPRLAAVVRAIAIRAAVEAARDPALERAATRAGGRNFRRITISA